MTRVKVCGITRADDGRLAVELGASALGFNFYSGSLRYVTPESARSMIGELPPFVSAVGVFADESDAARVVAIARQARVTTIQLHGPRFPEDFEPLDEFPLIRAIPVTADFTSDILLPLKAKAFLLDAFDPERIGGTGETVDWGLARKAAGAGRPIILAGGLTPENVGEAIRIVRPYAVDVATGVESSPGVKDAGKMRAFFAAVNDANSQHEDLPAGLRAEAMSGPRA